MSLTIIVPTFNEAPNVAELVARVIAATGDLDASLLFVDDSTDATADEIRRVAATTDFPISLLHRDQPTAGLSGAVVEGLRMSDSDWCIVMDGDLQHPPELIPVMMAAATEGETEVVVASRYLRGSGASSAGLSSGMRHVVSSGTTMLTRAMFPLRLRDCSDPMTGFFAVRRDALDFGTLRPRGFKILLEILARKPLSIVEVPFVFGKRFAGESKANLRQGISFIAQLAALRFGRLAGFAGIGAVGAVANLLILSGLQALGMWYLLAAVIAAGATIVANFLLQEWLVFRDLRDPRKSFWTRFTQSISFNVAETGVRTGLLYVIVESTSLHSVPVQAVLIGVSFLIRFVFVSRVVYPPARTSSAGFDVAPATLPSLSEVQNGELDR